MPQLGTMHPLLALTTSLLLCLWGSSATALGQGRSEYWGTSSPLLSLRGPMGSAEAEITYYDLDDDGDPDLMRYQLESVTILWIDDDDDMKEGDLEGDLDSDCLLTDINGDGIFGGPHDLIIDWNDENGDQVADMQVLIQQTPNSEANTGPEDAEGYYLWQIDYDNNGNFQSIDWRSLTLAAASESDLTQSLEAYSGDLTFTQARVSSYNLKHLAFNHENPFHGYDPDQDGLTEYTIRFTELDLAPDFDYPIDRTFDTLSHEPNFDFYGQVTQATIAFDADNDNDPERPFDFDFAVQVQGKGIQYGKKEENKFKSMRGLPGTDSLFYDPRFRQLDHLTFARRGRAQRMMFEEGEWEQASFVFDEDDDCRRWDRVELIPPMGAFADDANASDLRGDRAEWDLDFSGQGQLYLSPLDGRLHLFGAETGLWQVDQGKSHQKNHHRPWQGMAEEDKVVTFLYQDSDSNGYVDEIRIDLDGDQIFEELMSARALGINDAGTLISPARWTYDEVQALFRSMATRQWEQAQLALQAAEAYGLNPQWYSLYRNPKSLQQQYDYGYWLCFYIYHDLSHLMRNNLDRQNDLYRLRRAYLSTNWSLK